VIPGIEGLTSNQHSFLQLYDLYRHLSVTIVFQIASGFDAHVKLFDLDKEFKYILVHLSALASNLCGATNDEKCGYLCRKWTTIAGMKAGLSKLGASLALEQSRGRNASAHKHQALEQTRWCPVWECPCGYYCDQSLKLHWSHGHLTRAVAVSGEKVGKLLCPHPNCSTWLESIEDAIEHHQNHPSQDEESQQAEAKKHKCPQCQWHCASYNSEWKAYNLLNNHIPFGSFPPAENEWIFPVPFARLRYYSYI